MSVHDRLASMMLDQERLASAQLDPAPPCRVARGQSARLLSGRHNSKRGAQPEGLHGTFGMKTDDVAWAATQIVSYTCQAMFTTGLGIPTTHSIVQNMLVAETQTESQFNLKGQKGTISAVL